jgi:hypothetical protein
LPDAAERRSRARLGAVGVRSIRTITLITLVNTYGAMSHPNGMAAHL